MVYYSENRTSPDALGSAAQSARHPRHAAPDHSPGPTAPTHTRHTRVHRRGRCPGRSRLRNGPKRTPNGRCTPCGRRHPGGAPTLPPPLPAPGCSRLAPHHPRRCCAGGGEAGGRTCRHSRGGWGLSEADPEAGCQRSRAHSGLVVGGGAGVGFAGGSKRWAARTRWAGCMARCLCRWACMRRSEPPYGRHGASCELQITRVDREESGSWGRSSSPGGGGEGGRGI